MIQFSSNKKQDRSGAILKALEDGPLEARGIADRCMSNTDSMRRYIRRALEAGKIHICGWAGQNPIFRAGQGKDVQRPKVQPHLARERALIASQRRKKKDKDDLEKAQKLAKEAELMRRSTKAEWWHALRVTA